MCVDTEGSSLKTLTTQYHQSQAHVNLQVGTKAQLAGTTTAALATHMANA